MNHKENLPKSIILVEMKYTDTEDLLNVVLITLYICILLHVFLFSFAIILIMVYLCTNKQWLNTEFRQILFSIPNIVYKGET